ncbi:MAG: CgeB family protein, partial [Romboutsia sp.]|uniref:CgeB family protein n=1 Tax=Romboutsia sp. TaxID=1965302 RepID=UPI003F2DA450
MKFSSMSKRIFSCSNQNSTLLSENYIISNIKLLHEYEIFFKDNNPTCITNSFSVIKLVNNCSSYEEVTIPINTSYKFQNKNIINLEIEFNITENTIFSLYILEKPIYFKENEFGNSNIINNFIATIDNNQVSNKKSKPYFDKNIACILDEFTYECFNPEVNLLQLKSTTWRSDILDFKPDMLLVESVWNGICNTWIGKIACENTLDKTLLEIVSYCKEKQIPTVFFNKEGLVNFNYFNKNSSIFDYIFVTDENIIPIQMKISNHNKVYPLSFAAQPKIHNSINKNKYKLGTFAFAGGWYDNKHLDRLIDFEYIIKPALNYNIHIYDRNYHQRSMLEFIDMYWPEIYKSSILGKLDYNYMVHAQKNYDCFLNVNSVQDSSYMVSRRVYEILCCKTMVLSSYSKGIYSNFKDFIFISHNIDETVSILKQINESPSLCNKLSKKSQRYILENHTYRNRISEIFDTVNINYVVKKTINVILLAFLDDIKDIPNLTKVIHSQQYDNISIALLTPHNIKLNASLDLLHFNNLNHYNYSTLNNLKEIFDKIYVEDSYFAIINGNNYYGPNYIRDYINILSFADFDVLGKSNIFTCQNNTLDIIKCDNKDSYVDSLYKDTIFFNSKYFQFFSQNPIILEEHIIQKNNFIFYSDDEFNFISNFNILYNL